jgi:hypothetical protein
MKQLKSCLNSNASTEMAVKSLLDLDPRSTRASLSENTSPEPLTRLFSTALLSEEPKSAKRLVIWSPCGGTGRATLALALELRESGRHSRIILWDVNARALLVAELCAFTLGIPIEVEVVNAFTAHGKLASVQADYAIADVPMGLAWKEFNEQVSSIADDGGFPWGLPPGIDATWLFVQVLRQGLSPSGRAVCAMAQGPLHVSSTEHIRDRLLDDDLIESIVHLPPGTSLSTSIERSMMVLCAAKRQNRQRKITLINAREQFAAAQQGSRTMRMIPAEGMNEIRKALTDPRPTRLSRAVAPGDLREVEVTFFMPRLLTTGSSVRLRRRLPRGTDVRDWLNSRYGPDAGIVEYSENGSASDLRGGRFFERRELAQAGASSRPLSKFVTALRLPNREGLKTQFGTEAEGLWLVLRAGGVHVEESPPAPEVSPSEAGRTADRWSCAFQVSEDLDLHFAAAVCRRSFEAASQRMMQRLNSSSASFALSGLDEIDVPALGRTMQQAILESMSRLEVVQIRAQSDLEDVWAGRLTLPELKRRTDTFLGEEEFALRLQQWPNPIASAAWIVEAAKSDTAELETAINRFWEAVAGFHSTILLSAIQRIPDLEEPTLNDIRSGVDGNGHLSFREASLGLFAMMANTSAGKIRRYLERSKNSPVDSTSKSSEDDTPTKSPEDDTPTVSAELAQVSSAFGGLSTMLVEQLVSKDVVEVFERVKPLRTAGAHGGKESALEREDRVRRMYALIGDWDLRTRNVWSSFQLVRGGVSSRLEGHYDQQVELIVGNAYPFLKIQVPIVDPLISGATYMYCRESRDAMPLRAALFEFHEWPDESKFACYYYNRSNGELLDLKSFVFSGEAPECANSSMISDTIHWLQG